ncbi:hypothetical protein L6V77_14490, partial [Myxococcota bacterium]|nr:hypothetical protein [Myxococcota bacterium]
MPFTGLLAILLSGAAGGALILHAGRAYRGETGIGLLLVALIGLGFLAGLAELLVRERRAAASLAAARGLPATLPDAAALAALRAGLSPRWLPAFDALLAGRRTVEVPSFT